MSQLVKEIQAAEEEVILGNVILYPTDTVWGIGCDAENAEAVRKIFKIKEREESKTMILLMADLDMLKHYVEKVPEDLEKLIEEQERPTTYVLLGATNLPQEVIAEDGSIAVRITKDEFSHRLVRQIGRPLVSTSANISGENTAESFKDISDKIKERVDHVVRWQQDEEVNTKPSRIVKVEPSGKQTVIRD
ncbi:L-threonylcarbamoyladenylate synthase [Pontibacter cellulosilyticus]|uniref:L-threonylcarbamoyladenylate synthase n=1 Tax=Pontibacter cellulosilyticus TaxID=1720253 RepID=A0A923SKD3_9BACT|nr:L-threonylcarbamoyladenylate synthase [Pontibacter cellulosilyticus]MBC5994627.1 threonylcarbamoyl-AMP synthase [Pontibacter cellulosilyticus]